MILNVILYVILPARAAIVYVRGALIVSHATLHATRYVMTDVMTVRVVTEYVRGVTIVSHATRPAKAGSHAQSVFQNVTVTTPPVRTLLKESNSLRRIRVHSSVLCDSCMNLYY